MRATFAVRIPFGKTELSKRGSFSVVRNKFRDPENKIRTTYAVMKGSEEVKSFDNSLEAFTLQKDKADKEAKNV